MRTFILAVFAIEALSFIGRSISIALAVGMKRKYNTWDLFHLLIAFAFSIWAAYLLWFSPE